MKSSNNRLIFVYALLVAIFVLLVGILFVLVRLDAKVDVLIDGGTGSDVVKPVPEPEKPGPEPVVSAGTIYFVLDDAGNNLSQLLPFLDLPFTLTVAVMPQLEFSVESARRVSASRHDLIMHQPMEAFGGNNPGPGAIYATMQADEIASILAKNFETVPNALGINNHMGSKVTADLTRMVEILTFLKTNNLFYLDSYTSGESKGKAAAEQVGMTYFRRNSIFLDNEDDAAKIEAAIRQGMIVASKEGYAVMIGHVFSENLAEVLLKMYPEFLAKNYRLEGLSDLYYGEKR
ncbi:MAG: divergent polysaccharide deacetylase family protein [Spirochaetales bacterium]|nr:divergent polysaccharide deacetylase family protein [Spirochaetales bacterium]